ncbi:major facilitator superfamily protein, putative [Ichthyophthirius multifiliis]|uniref:Hexose transporter 1 n=1 Tax=Ichthyophthirius multifiliis TaxID=5932 RepID=G0R3D2_ICHMU|nr:major facilitator superfamily protein, putative [Ichthyophthirius multifiliis]EGR28024.1 major facilitator superfamily protein, putative [Ichthyophthirius multifiliis]|eukprot:XP_004027369.1 major facilitator superfamily protein, putative [Ichthyophthirius multifiliis]
MQISKIDKHKSTLQITLITLSSCLGSLYIGYQIGVFSLASDTTFIVFKTSQENIALYQALLTCFIPLGASVGSLSSGKLLDIFSRRTSSIICDMFGIISSFMSQFSNIKYLPLSRFLAGITTGLNSSIVPLYIQEISPNEVSGKMGIIFNMGINMGIIFATFLGIFFSQKPSQKDEDYWRFVFIFPAFICVSRYLILKFIYNFETPLFYALKSEDYLCEKSLKIIYKNEYVQEIKDQIQNQAQKIKNQKESFKNMISIKYRKRLTIGCLLQIFQQWSGINAVIMYSGQIFGQLLDNDFFQKNMISLLSNIVLFLASFFSSFFINVLGRKKILLWGSALCFLFLGILAIVSGSGFHQETSFLFIFAYYISFNFSLGPLVWLYNSEILPEKGISIATSCNWVAGSIITLALPYLNGNIWPLFAFFAFVCACCVVFVQLLVKETLGKNKDEIGNLYLPEGHLFDENKNLQDGEKQKTYINA